MHKIIPILFSITLLTSCNESTKSVDDVTVIAQIKQYTSSDEPRTTGNKFYHFNNTTGYKTLQVYKIQDGNSTLLGKGNLENDKYATLSFYTERTNKEYWSWCIRSHVRQDPFFQDYIEDGWRLANASWNRKIKLESTEPILDVIIFCKKGEYLATTVLHKMTVNVDSVATITDYSKKHPNYQFSVLTIK